ncbi:hypothetical protein HC928_02540 [bacterium]|nr:hypothetical protein [bacterium]
MAKAFTTSTLNYPQNAPSPIQRVSQNRAPLSTDNKNFIPGDEWLDTSSRDWWKLVDVMAGSALWVKIGSDGGHPETLEGNSGGPVGPNGSFNIFTVGNNVQGIDVDGNPATNTLTFSGIDTSETQKGVVELATAIETGELMDVTRAITPASLEPILVTPYVVAPGGRYPTIQTALDAANTAGGGMVWVRPGIYPENLIFYDGIQISGPSEQDVLIIGTHTPPSSGTLNIDRLSFQSETDIFNSSEAGTTAIIMEDCAVFVTNGYTFNLINFTPQASVACFNIGNFGTNDGFFYNTGGCQFYVFAAGFGNGTSNSCNISGPFVISQATIVGCPVIFNTGTEGLGVGSQFTNGITLSGNSSCSFSGCDFSGTGSAITMNSSMNNFISRCSINTPNNPAIEGSGAGILTLTTLSFINNSSISGSLNLGSSSIYPIEMSDGQLLIGETGQCAVPNTLTAGAGISITNAAGSITITSTGGGFSWNEITVGGPTQMAVHNGYVANTTFPTVCDLLLPATAAIGDTVQILGKGMGGWRITQNAGQSINYVNLTSTVGMGGSISSIDQFCCIEIKCITANTGWNVADSNGGITIV